MLTKITRYKTEGKKRATAHSYRRKIRGALLSLARNVLLCNTPEHVDAAAALAQAVSAAGMNNRNYLLFLVLLETNNPTVVDVLVGERNPFLLFSPIKPNWFLIKEAFRILAKYKGNELSAQGLLALLGVVQNAYKTSKDGNKIYPLRMSDVYNIGKQQSSEIAPLKEEDAYPADAEDGYGWEKLYMERMCRHWREDFGVDTRVARFHNIYGPMGSYDGGREKSPAAICRKVAMARDGDEIEVWGDGLQTRSYCYVADTVRGINLLTESDCPDPVNIGRDDSMSINDLVQIVAGVAGKRIRMRYDLTKPKGVRGRNADLTMLRRVTGWEPRTDFVTGIRETYNWIYSELRKKRMA